jgi:metal-responsive CopG/Arc/MetJ family transcriptional regulator
VNQKPPDLPSRYFAISARAGQRSSSRLISVRLPEDLLQRLADVGNAEALGMSDTIRLVLERGLDATKNSKPATNKIRKA